MTYPYDHHKNNFVISVSPNGKELASLDISNNTLQTWKLIDKNLIPIEHFWQHHQSSTTDSALFSRSIAISDRDKNNNIFIVISKVYEQDLHVKGKKRKEEEKTEESLQEVVSSLSSSIPHHNNRPSIDSDSTLTYHNNSAVLASRPNHHNNSSISSIPTHHNNSSISSIPTHHHNSSVSSVSRYTHHNNSSVSSISKYTHHSNPSVSSHPNSRNTHHQNNLSVASTPIFTHQHNLSVDSSNFAFSIDPIPSYREEHAIIIIHVKADKTKRIIDSSTIRGLRGGIVEFIDSNTLIILRGTEFTRIVLEEDKILNFTLHPDQFQYQESMIRELKMCSLKSSKALLSRTVVKHYFFLCKSTRENNIFEMYDLRDFELKHVFHTKKIGIDNLGCEYNNDGGFRTPLYAISENGKLMAVSLCKKSIAIFLIENSLMVAIHDFCNKSDSDNLSSAKILDMKFYDNDEKLVVLTQEGNNEVYTTIWDLFNCNIHNPYTAHLDPSSLQSLEEPIDYGMRKYKQSKGRPLGIFSNYLVYPSQFVNGNNGVYLIPFDQEEFRWNKYVTKININEVNVYNDKKNHYKVFDHNGKLLDRFDRHKLIIKDSEPWNNSDDKSQIVVWLNDKKTIQLIIGNETIQVWEEHKKLVYIWAPLLSRSYYIDTFNKPTDSPISSLSYSRSDHCKIHRFILKKFSNHQYQYKIRFSFGDKDISKHLPREKDYIKSACNAIEFLQWQMKHTKYLDNKLRRYLNKTIQETRLLIKKFINEQPQTWKLLDIKECIMSHLVAAGCDDLISYIVYEKRDLMLHNPRRYAWSKRESDECNRLIRLIDVKRKISNREIPQVPQQEKKRLNGDCLRKPSDLKIAIDHKNKNAVKGLVRYYSILAMDHTGWMFTVSDELLELLKYNSDYVVDLFYQPIFGSKEAPHLSEASIMSEISLPGTKNSLHVLHDIQTKLNKSPNTTDNKLLDLKNAAPWVMACMVPLPDFTVPKDEKDETSKQSTFIQMVISSSNDNMDFIFDNPAMEAIVDFKWCTYAKKIIYFLLALYGFYQLCFTYLCYAYIAHLSSNDWKWVFFYPFACWILLFGMFLLICEASQGKLLKKNYFRIYNLFDLLSGILPLLSTTLLLVFSYSQWKLNNNGFENIKTDSIVLILLSITMLTLWIELLMRMRSLQIIGEYVFLIINLSKRIAPFLGTMLVVICGLAHSMFILLSRPNDINLIPDQNTYTLLNTATQESYTLIQNIDVNSDNDNLFHNFFTSIKAVYFWINGQWDQIDQWNFWPVVGLSIFGSLFLVIIMQNILIALMSDVVDEAKEIGKRAFLKLRAELIAEVEVFFLTKRQLHDKVLFPRHIYFIINCDEANRWLEKCRRRNNIGYSNYGGKDRRESIHSNNSTKKDYVNSENNEPFGNKNRLAEIEKNINLLIELAKNNP